LGKFRQISIYTPAPKTLVSRFFLFHSFRFSTITVKEN
jgi:hypothetical protein